MAKSETLSTVFIDTNILVYANLAHSPFHQSAIDTLNTYHEQDVALRVSRQILREYLAAMSRLNTLTVALPIPSLAQDVRNFTAQFNVAEESPQVTEELLTLFSTITIGGKQVHDANIVATMLVHKIGALLTHNVSDFKRFDHLITVLPLIRENTSPI